MGFHEVRRISRVRKSKQFLKRKKAEKESDESRHNGLLEIGPMSVNVINE